MTQTEAGAGGASGLSSILNVPAGAVGAHFGEWASPENQPADAIRGPLEEELLQRGERGSPDGRPPIARAGRLFATSPGGCVVRGAMVRRCVRLANTDVRALCRHVSCNSLPSNDGTLTLERPSPSGGSRPPIAKVDFRTHCLSSSLCRNLWRKSIKPADANVAHSCICHAPSAARPGLRMDWSLERPALLPFARSIHTRTYCPQASHIIRSAKSSGLSVTCPRYRRLRISWFTKRSSLALAESDLMPVGTQDRTRFGWQNPPPQRQTTMATFLPTPVVVLVLHHSSRTRSTHDNIVLYNGIV